MLEVQLDFLDLQCYYFMPIQHLCVTSQLSCLPQFSFKSCKFRVQKSKEGTGRIVMWRLGIKNSYTMEATFGGSTLGKLSFPEYVSL